MNAIDAFAGAGGWEEGLKPLGIDPLGIELDEAACATREAAGLRTLQGDMAQLDPAAVAYGEFATRLVDLFLGSPPCPTYSSAGNGAGRHLTEIVVRCMHELAAGDDTRAERREDAYTILEPVCWEAEQKKAAKKEREPDRAKADARARRDADMSLLVVEPLRWVLALEPRWVALEQVPEVLPLWSEMAQILGTLGYSTWVGVMEAERYGVPQTRERAILMADREQPVHPPIPTHQRYVKGELQRHEVTLEGEVLPWISMAEALGWAESDELEYQRGEGMNERHGDRPGRRGDEPSFVIRAGTGGIGTGLKRRFRSSNRGSATVREAEEPAPTVHFGHRANEVCWVYDRRQTGGDGTPVGPRSGDEPAPTLQAQGLAKGRDVWSQEGRQPPGENIGGRNWGGGGPTPHERPATTVAGDPRLSSPSHHNHGEQNAHAIRVTLEEALILQSFPPDYPVQGTKSQRFLQVGSAIPPLLARAIVGALVQSALHQEQVGA